MPQVSTLGDLKIVQEFLKIETSSGRGEELVRLVQDANDGGRWKAFILFTTLQELEGHEEAICNRRPTGFGISQDNGGQNWRDRLTAQQNFEDGREPTVLILGRLFRPGRSLTESANEVSFSKVLVKVDSLSLLGSSNLA